MAGLSQRQNSTPSTILTALTICVFVGEEGLLCILGEQDLREGTVRSGGGCG